MLVGTNQQSFPLKGSMISTAMLEDIPEFTQKGAEGRSRSERIPGLISSHLNRCRWIALDSVGQSRPSRAMLFDKNQSGTLSLKFGSQPISSSGFWHGCAFRTCLVSP